LKQGYSLDFVEEYTGWRRRGEKGIERERERVGFLDEEGNVSLVLIIQEE